MKRGYNDFVKRFVLKLGDAYNEFALLIIEALKPQPDVTTIVILALSSLTMNVLNGGKSFPTGAPGPWWWGSGFQKDMYHKLMTKEDTKEYVDVMKDDGFASGAVYNDDMLRAATPFLVTALVNLAVLMNESVEDVGWAEVIVFASSEGYLACFLFALICVIETTSRGNYGDYPLSTLRQHVGKDMARAITILCQLLCACAFVVVNLGLYFIPGDIRVIAVGAFVFYGGIFLRYRTAEPGMVAVAWYKSNLRYILYPVLYVLSDMGFLQRLFKWWTLPAEMFDLTSKYFRNYWNSWLYMLIFVVAFVLSLLVKLETIILYP